MGLPVVIAAAGGLPVTPSANAYGLPVTVALNGRGLPVTIADNDMGLPVLLEGGGGLGARIMITARSVLETVPIGTVIGALSMVNVPGNWGTTTFSEQADPDGKFTVSGGNLVSAAAFDRETKALHSVTVRATPSGPYGFVDRTFSIGVLNVLEVTLAALTVSGSTIVAGTSGVLGAIVGKSAGSTVTFATGSAANFGGRATITGTGEALSISINAVGLIPSTGHQLTLVEGHPDGNNSPRESTVLFDIIAA